MVTFFVHWFDDLLAVKYVDDIVNGLRTAFRFLFQSPCRFFLTGISLQGFVHRDNYPCKSIPVREFL